MKERIREKLQKNPSILVESKVYFFGLLRLFVEEEDILTIVLCFLARNDSCLCRI